ncbi:MAG: hypothetical protein VX202_08555 [Pseudomonadota bacterium]|nr:hypothetical protein [Pseudomonadota bacterium]
MQSIQHPAVEANAQDALAILEESLSYYEPAEFVAHDEQDQKPAHLFEYYNAA